MFTARGASITRVSDSDIACVCCVFVNCSLWRKKGPKDRIILFFVSIVTNCSVF